jgi:hypothetical protein
LDNQSALRPAGKINVGDLLLAEMQQPRSTFENLAEALRRVGHAVRIATDVFGVEFNARCKDHAATGEIKHATQPLAGGFVFGIIGLRRPKPEVEAWLAVGVDVLDDGLLLQQVGRQASQYICPPIRAVPAGASIALPHIKHLSMAVSFGAPLSSCFTRRFAQTADIFVFQLGVESVGHGDAPIKFTPGGLEIQARAGGFMIAVCLLVAIERNGLGQVAIVRRGEIDRQPDVLRPEMVKHIGILKHVHGGGMGRLAAVVVVLDEVGHRVDVVGRQFVCKQPTDLPGPGGCMVWAVLGTVVKQPTAEKHLVADVDVGLHLPRKIHRQTSDGQPVSKHKPSLSPVVRIQFAEGLARDVDYALSIHGTSS